MRKTIMLVFSLGLVAGLALWSHAARGSAAQEQVAGDWSAKVRDTDFEIYQLMLCSGHADRRILHAQAVVGKRRALRR